MKKITVTMLLLCIALLGFAKGPKYVFYFILYYRGE